MEKKEEKETNYELVQVPTNHVIAIQTPEGEVITQEQAIVQILNDIREIKKKI